MIGGSAAVAAVVIAVTVVALGGNGGSGGGGTGGGTAGTGATVDYLQYQLDVELGGSISLSTLDSIDSPSASDCAAAAADVGKLQADSRTWPRVLSAPMSQAEAAFSAAAKDCSDEDFTTMQTDYGRGQGFLSATRDAFAAHCRPSDTKVTIWQC